MPKFHETEVLSVEVEPRKTIRDSSTAAAETPLLGCAWYEQDSDNPFAVQMCGILDRLELLQQYGDVMLWSAWAALHRARLRGVPWCELGPMAAKLAELVRRGPNTLTKTRFARTINVLGVRSAERLRSVLCNELQLEATGNGRLSSTADLASRLHGRVCNPRPPGS